MRLTVNGRTHELAVDPGARLLNVLRDTLHLTGAKYGCGHGECGTCTVLVNGRLKPLDTVARRLQERSGR